MTGHAKMEDDNRCGFLSRSQLNQLINTNNNEHEINSI